MKVQCATCYGQILMIDAAGESRLEGLATLLVKIYQNSSIIRMVCHL